MSRTITQVSEELRGLSRLGADDPDRLRAAFNKAKAQVAQKLDALHEAAEACARINMKNADLVAQRISKIISDVEALNV